jgi:hypothetical protein
MLSSLLEPSALRLLAMACLAATIALVYAGAALRRPSLLVYPYLLLAFFLPESQFGNLDASGGTLWARGSGQLLFPLVQWGLIAALAWALLAARLKERPVSTAPMMPWFAGFAVLMLGHLIVGTATGVDPIHVLSPNGFMNLLWTGLFVLLLVNVFDDPIEVERLADAIVVCAALRAAYGLARFVLREGDPTNVYANLERLALKITFFDISDSLLLAIGTAIALLRALGPATAQRRPSVRALHLGVALLCAITVALSFRRTAQGGLLLAMLVVLFNLPRRVRMVALFAGLPLALAAVSYAASIRLSQMRGAEGLMAWVYDVVPNPFGPDTERIAELRMGWQEFVDHPLFGIGAWGQYRGAHMIFWQAGERPGEFLHSALLHIGMKTGIVGVVLLVGLVVSFVRGARPARLGEPPGSPADQLRVAGLAGLAFVIPDFLVGTPLAQTRTMLMWGLCLALPFVARAAVRATKPTPQGRTTRPPRSGEPRGVVAPPGRRASGSA